MIVFIVCVLCAVASSRAQPDNSIWVDVGPLSPENVEVEKRYTPEVLEELHSAAADALLLYTEYTAQASTDLQAFLMNISRLSHDTFNGMDQSLLNNARLKKIEYDAHRLATFSAENHHKFFLGHMIVFRMHLNKSEDYIKKCDKVVKTCGTSCETIPRISRWRRLALAEIHRVRDDIQHSRRSYKDLLIHNHRRLNHLRKRASSRTTDAIDILQACIRQS
ncbi:unnamed protein product [Leptidea sinapis]|uniref:Prolyl 4-hydroxylase alpha-subunit N-terminal domain-containing protein n=1 Tax=Leptidea sinapis TaxID=189913 RepID=A0A5E4R7S6_9NEOP|nr:unnamed protein product [Leptidea sinapis]